MADPPPTYSGISNVDAVRESPCDHEHQYMHRNEVDEENIATPG
jgi:hypothetical protein